MKGIGRLVRRLLRWIMPEKEPPEPERYDRHWGEWWVFVGEFRRESENRREE